MRSLRLIVHDISCELDWRWCCRWRISGCLAENPLVGVSATYSIASSTRWQPHLLYLIWDEDGSKKSLLKETMCNKVRLVLSMQLNTVLFSLHHTGIYLATGAVGIQRVKDGKSVIQTARCFTGCYTALHIITLLQSPRSHGGVSLYACGPPAFLASPEACDGLWQCR